MIQPIADKSYFFMLRSFKARLLFVLVSCLVLNLNTIRNQYALDDEMIINKNMNVHMGFSGIGKILGTDAYQGFLDIMGASTPLSGGRYRPLSIVSFAIEEQLFTKPLGKEYWAARKKFNTLQTSATDMEQVKQAAREVKDLEAQIKQQTLDLAPVRHAFQVVYFTLSMLFLFWFLHQYLLPKNQDIAFLATLLFAFHPIHTEVIANLKSRDEIFSLLFILLSCIYVFKYIEHKTSRNLLLLILFTIAALLSKEYAILIPFTAFTAVVLTRKEKPLSVVKSTWFVVLTALSLLLLLVRYNIVGKNKKFTLVTDVLNDPFMYATASQKIATKIALLNEYLKLLVFPYPLSADYSYSHFPYYSFADWQVWASVLVWGAIVYITIRLWKQKNILAFACLFFLSFFMLVNNLLFEIGATMGERLVYHSSLGFCIVAAWLIVKGVERIPAEQKVRSTALLSVTALILVGFGYQTIARNAYWKNDFTLFTHDVKFVRNSALANGNAGAEYYNKGYNYITGIQKPSHRDSIIFIQYTDTAKGYLTKALIIHPRYVNSYLNRALCYMQQGQMDSAIKDWKTAAANFQGRNPSLIEHAKMLLSMGEELGSKKDYKLAAKFLNDASMIDAGNADIWDNLGGSEFMQANFEASAYAFNRALSINPNLQDAKMGAGAAGNFVALINKCRQDSLNPVLWRELAQAYKMANFTELSEQADQKAARLTSGK